ncbi:MAG TPA: hypothetical protein PK189_07940 [bacterium]|nr:hypothetical protein [bacterium]
MKKIYKWLIVLVILVISTIIYFFISKKKVIIIGDSYIVNLQNFCKNSNNCISRNNFIFFGINGMTSEELLLSIIKNNIFSKDILL